MAAWSVTLIAGLLSALVIGANLRGVFRLFQTARGPEPQSFTPIPLAGGLLGAVAISNCPVEAAQAWYVVPLFLDPGTCLYVLILLFASTVGSVTDWISRRSQLAQTRDASTSSPLGRALAGSMLGTAVGDALGLACEGLSPQRQMKMFPSLDRYGLLFGTGMISDDTEHTVMLAQALIESGGDEVHFARDFAWRLKGWLLALPAGVGMATGRAIIKLWLFFLPTWSGVRSAGNGPAMRAAVLGVAFGDDPVKLESLNRLAARITHRDDRAEHGALTVAIAAHLAATSQAPVSAKQFVQTMSQRLPPQSATLASIVAVAQSLEQSESAPAFVARLGSKNGVSGYMLHTLPAVLHVWLRHQDDYQGGITEMIRLGGDSDSTAAILGGIIGARVGRGGIPAQLLKNLRDWPRSTSFIERVAQRLAHTRLANTRMREVRSFLLATPVRNLFFLAVVLAHGFRRLLPPY
jgi:ADP-ribosyl-[dinitrogen reductase] hydrolase